MKTTCTCPCCNASIKIPQRYVGRSIACPRCGNRFTAAGHLPTQPPPLPAAGNRSPPVAASPAVAANPRPSSMEPRRFPWLYAAGGACMAVALMLAFLVGRTASVPAQAPVASQAVDIPRKPERENQPLAKKKEPKKNQAQAKRPDAPARSAEKSDPAPPAAEEPEPEPAPAEAPPAPEPTKAKPSEVAQRELTPKELFAKASGAVALIEIHGSNGQRLGLGSGFFVDAEGTLVTNAHVALADGTAFLLVKLADDTTYFADEVAAFSHEDDIAVVKVKANGTPFIELCKTPAETGERAVAIGNPLGLESTISEGLVSGVREIDAKKRSLIQTTAAISHGSSGGPLLNARAEVLGVTTAFLGGGQNLNFAVPASVVATLLSSKAEPKKLAAIAPVKPAGAVPAANGQQAVRYVNGKEVLSGLKSVCVIVEQFDQSAKIAGLREATLRTRAELSLRTLGIPVKDTRAQQRDARMAYLYIRVTSIASEDLDSVGYNLELNLHETVALLNSQAGDLITSSRLNCAHGRRASSSRQARRLGGPRVKRRRKLLRLPAKPAE